MKMAMPITDTTTSIATMVSIADTSLDELRLQSLINYGLKFSGVVVTLIGRECGPINLKISVWPYISKWADAQAFDGALVGDHGNPERSTQAAGRTLCNRRRRVCEGEDRRSVWA
jgi:hypothetical protein